MCACTLAPFPTDVWRVTDQPRGRRPMSPGAGGPSSMPGWRQCLPGARSTWPRATTSGARASGARARRPRTGGSTRLGLVHVEVHHPRPGDRPVPAHLLARPRSRSCVPRLRPVPAHQRPVHDAKLSDRPVLGETHQGPCLRETTGRGLDAQHDQGRLRGKMKSRASRGCARAARSSRSAARGRWPAAPSPGRRRRPGARARCGRRPGRVPAYPEQQQRAERRSQGEDE